MHGQLKLPACHSRLLAPRPASDVAPDMLESLAQAAPMGGGHHVGMSSEGLGSGSAPDGRPWMQCTPMKGHLHHPQRQAAALLQADSAMPICALVGQKVAWNESRPLLVKHPISFAAMHSLAFLRSDWFFGIIETCNDGGAAAAMLTAFMPA